VITVVITIVMLSLTELHPLPFLHLDFHLNFNLDLGLGTVTVVLVVVVIIVVTIVILILPSCGPARPLPIERSIGLWRVLSGRSIQHCYNHDLCSIHVACLVDTQAVSPPFWGNTWRKCPRPWF